MLSLTIYRAGRVINDLGKRIGPTLDQINTISNRLELLSRGLEGGDRSIASLLDALGAFSQGLERNMKLYTFSSSLLAAVGPAVGSFIQTMFHKDEAAPEAEARPEAGRPPVPQNPEVHPEAP